jgi:hypothetical protein
MSEMPADDSITVDVDDVGFDPPPPPSVRRHSSGSLAASGVRGASPDDPDGDYEEEDAPQFFDRAQLASQGKIPIGAPSSPTAQRAAPPAAPSGPVVPRRPAVTTGPPIARAAAGASRAAGAQADPVDRVLKAAAVADLVRAAVGRARRVPAVWAVAAAIAVALAVVAALALR